MSRTVLKIVLGILVILAAVLGTWGLLEYNRWNRPWAASQDKSYMLEISEGMSARQIGERLKEDGVIRNVPVFLVLADLRGIADKLKAGEYEITWNKTPYEIMDMLAKGESFRRALVIPEGYTQIQIGEACEKLEICTKDEFLKECQKNNVFNFVAVQAPGDANAACEGALFPDTYYFIRNTPAERVFNRMRQTFELAWAEIAESEVKDVTGLWWVEDGQVDLVNQHKVIVMASLVERESKREEDKPVIASVLVNRLKSNMPLQVDSTIHYALNDWTRPLTYSDLDLDSPYNTYKKTGLPPAAICNPGKTSLKAAMNPPQTDYLYFIANSQGETLFTKTLDEHNALKNQFRQERREARESQTTGQAGNP